MVDENAYRDFYDFMKRIKYENRFFFNDEFVDKMKK
jgi:hypothetical protein